MHEITVSPTRVDALLATVRSGLLVEDAERRVVMVNDRFVEMFGLPSAEVMVGADCALAAEGAKHDYVDPDAFIAGGGMGQLAAGSGGSRASALSSALSVSFGTSAGSTNTQVQGYLASLGSLSDPSLTLSERLQAESELSFASGQPAGGTTGVDYWTETLGV